MASSASLRLFSPTITTTTTTTTTTHLSKPLLRKPSHHNHHLLSLASPISFHRLTTTLATPSPPKASSSSTSQPPSSSVDPAHLPPRLRDIVSLFQSVPDPKTRYKQLLAYAAKLPPMDPALKTDANRVRGCVSQVWVHASPDPPGRVRFQADSDAQLTKGLATLLVLGLSGAPAREVARVPVEFIELLGIKQSLSPSRSSGLLNMLNLMKRKALELAAAEGGDGIVHESSQEDEKPHARSPVEDESKAATKYAAFDVKEDNLVAEAYKEQELDVGNGSLGGGRKERIRERLEKELSPVELEIEDISHLHKGHAGVAGSSGETHFNVWVVSRAFEGKSLLKRHRVVYDLLQEELKTGLHALSIDAKTPSEV